MYSVEDEDTSSSETTEDNVETVKTTDTHLVGGGLLQAVVSNPSESESAGVMSKNEDDIGIEEEDEADIDEYFNDLFPDRNRLDTVEEVTEPMSSYHESLPLDLADDAKISGQPSSDFAHESLPPDFNHSMTSMSVTSREEMYSVSEVEVLATTWPPPHYSSPLSSQRTLEAAPEAGTLGTMAFSTKGNKLINGFPNFLFNFVKSMQVRRLTKKWSNLILKRRPRIITVAWLMIAKTTALVFPYLAKEVKRLSRSKLAF